MLDCWLRMEARTTCRSLRAERVALLQLLAAAGYCKLYWLASLP